MEDRRLLARCRTKSARGRLPAGRFGRQDPNAGRPAPVPSSARRSRAAGWWRSAGRPPRKVFL